MLQQTVDFGVDDQGMDAGAEDAWIENCMYNAQGMPSCMLEQLQL